jgi:hypothetical protein
VRSSYRSKVVTEVGSVGVPSGLQLFQIVKLQIGGNIRNSKSRNDLHCYTERKTNKTSKLLQRLILPHDLGNAGFNTDNYDTHLTHTYTPGVSMVAPHFVNTTSKIDLIL